MIFFVLFLVFVIIQIITIIAYEGFTNKKTQDIFCRILEKKDNYLICGISHISVKNTFIAKTVFNVLGKYYIENLGIIPRWSKLSKKIDEIILQNLVS